MIVVVTPNPAIDITYDIATPRLGETNRVTRVVHRAGGKGLNVASVLAQTMQDDSTPARRIRISGFLGGRPGEEMRELLADSTAEQAWVERGSDHPTRATVAVVAADGQVTMLNEPGPTTTAADWQHLTTTALHGCVAGDVLVVSGSCPPGTSPEDLAGLLSAARAIGMRTVLDTSGPLLVACAPLADVVKPNREELANATGQASIQHGARTLLTQGVGGVAVSDGPQGMDLYVSGEDPNEVLAWHVDAPQLEAINPTGAGDSAVAALAAFLENHPPASQVNDQALINAVASSAAAVLTPVAGAVDLPTYQSLLTTLKAEKIHAAH